MSKLPLTADSLETRLYALFPKPCAEYDYGEESGLEGGPCPVVGLSVSLALAHVSMGKITEAQAYDRVSTTAQKVDDSGCKGMFLKEEPGCMADPLECGQNAEDFGVYIN